MSVIDVVLALFTLMTEISTVKVSGSSWDGFKMLKFLGSNLDSSVNSPVSISLTSLAGSLCTQSIAVSVADLEQFPGLGLDICDSGRLLLVDAAEAAEEVAVRSTGDSPAGVSGSEAGGGEPLKSRTAACAAADAAFSIASFNDPCTMDCTWVSYVADKSSSCGNSRSSRFWT